MVFYIVTLAVLGVLLLVLGIRVHSPKPFTGREGIIGEVGESQTRINEHGGTVFVHGEYWNAVSDCAVDKDRKVKIVAVQGSVLKVEAAG
jgi:membrane-bound serine protease (ClpP class)